MTDNHRETEARAVQPRRRTMALMLSVVLGLTLPLIGGNPAQAVAAKSTLNAVVSASVVESGGSSKVTATLKHGSAVLKSTPVVIQKRRAGTAKWYTAASGRTDAAGRFATKLTNITRNLEIRATYAGSRSTRGSVSPVKGIKARQWALITKTSGKSPVTGSNIQLKGRVSAGLAGLRIVVEKKNGTRWAVVSRGTVTKASTFSLRVKAGHAGTAYYRVRVPATKATATAKSAASKFTVFEWFGLEKLEAEPFIQGNPKLRPLLDGALTLNGVRHRAQIGSVYAADRFVNSSYREWRLGGKCSRFTGIAGFDDKRFKGNPVGYSIFDADKMEQSQVEEYKRLSPGVSEKFDVALRGSRTLRLGVHNAAGDADSGTWGLAGFASPRVLCNAKP